jgi:deoxyribodipyrimidine photo-lyase
MPDKILVWFKNDLRLCNNETWQQACAQGAEVIPVFIFDPRRYANLKLGFPKHGSFQTQFRIESVTALREQLVAKGSDLIVRLGLPEFVIIEICSEYKVSEVYTSREVTAEELKIIQNLRSNLEVQNTNLKVFETASLIHPEDLPFSLTQLPDQFTSFRKAVERKWTIRPLHHEPQVKPIPQIESGAIPSLQDLGLFQPESDNRSVITYQGGEPEALRRLQDYIWQKDLLKRYKETRNELIGADYSSKFSVALAHGCISPRTIYDEVKKYEQQRIANDSTYWLIFELLWRDYFRFVTEKYGAKIFHRKGIRNKETKWLHDVKKFEAWRTGNTGVDFVDANMKELLLTGFMSNRGRQNVASYLTKDLGIDWRWGAAWFESQLMDYDVCSNWLNWAYVAGVGNDPREDRYFNIESQVKKYDPDNRYTQLWLTKQL